MKKSPIKIDWTTTEDDLTWQASQSVPPASRASVERASLAISRKEWVTAALVAAVLLVLMGGWLWQRQSLAVRTSNEVHSVVVAEVQAQTETTQAAAGLVQNESYKRLGDRVMTQVIVQYLVDGKTRPYRETCFYEKDGSQWRRIDPDPQLMGPLQTLEIAHFTIRYQAVDADTVYEVAPKLGQLYAKMRRDVGLPVADATQPDSQRIEVTIGGVQSLSAGSFVSPTVSLAANCCRDVIQSMSAVSFVTPTMAVSSPALLSAPAEMTEATILYQAMVYHLALRAVYEQSHQHQEQWQSNFLHWFPIQRALPLWEMWEDNGPLADGREEVVRWLYQNEGRARQPLPEGYDRICRSFRIWQTVPWYLYIPLTCNEVDGAIESDVRFPEFTLHWMLHPQPSGQGKTISQNQLSSVVMVETIIEYIVATYGEEKVPVFINALGEYGSLDSLIPAVFDLSVADFEAGWQAYLAERYR